jgi:ribonuclease P protein component
MPETRPALRRLVARREFLRVARRGRRWATPGLVMQACPAENRETGDIGVGLTASRKVGKAVARNRARRRLRALARDYLPRHATAGHDYVLIARGATVTRPFVALQHDLKQALKRLKLYREPSDSAAA